MAVVTIAPIAARAPGSYTTSSKPVPAGLYSEIVFTLTFNNQATDFVPGDEIDGLIELSTDGGNTWHDLVSAPWKGGQPSGRTGGYYVAVGDLDVPANSLYRGRCTVTSSNPTVTFGVQANATLA